MISDFLKKRFLNCLEPLATLTMDAREGYHATKDSEPTFKERLVAACLVSREGRYEIRFIPGVTGHEAYIFDADFRKRVGEMRARGPERSFFGEKINMWFLCAGTPGRWASLEVTVEDVQAATKHFGEVVDTCEAEAKGANA